MGGVLSYLPFTANAPPVQEVQHPSRDITNQDSENDETGDDDEDGEILEITTARRPVVAQSSIVTSTEDVFQHDKLRALCMRDWVPEDDWPDGEYIPMLRYPET